MISISVDGLLLWYIRERETDRQREKERVIERERDCVYERERERGEGNEHTYGIKIFLDAHISHQIFIQLYFFAKLNA